MVSGENFKDILLRGELSYKKSIVVSFLNPYSYPIIAQHREILNGVNYWFSDGSLLCFISNLFRRKEDKITRASFDFSSIASDVFSNCVDFGIPVALVGGNEEEIVKARENISLKYKGINIVFYRDGYFTYDDYDQISKEIISSGAKVVIVGMGTPLQEKFSIALSKRKFNGFIFTCGGFLTQTSRKLDYYSTFTKKTGLRWLQRAFSDKHVRKRLTNQYPRFVFGYLYSRAFGNK
ncbi:WecB/TagA/CpsF family glycosyltransferase [Enterovibrio norvegicus]|uniref:WecB/TagA/CpsF family glycosyltransferase n=1 Tax=Enterovibrio norvegicus TaxID=188144 RepID=UPI00352E8318